MSGSAPVMADDTSLPPAGLMNEPSAIVSWLVGRLTDGGRLLLLTDYDGTLSPLVDSPGEAWLPHAVRADLLALARRSRIHLGVVSGRDLVDLRERVSVPDATYAGCHGLEIEGGGMSFQHPDAAAQQDVLGAISRQLTRRASTVPGMLVEPKRFGLAVHYRRVAPDQRRRVEAELLSAMRQDGSRFKIFHGSHVIEIQPQVAWTKGDCVLWIREVVERASPAPLSVLYMGDDWTDEHAFEALGRSAITIRVGGVAPASRAAYRVPDVTCVQRLLAELAARTREGAT